MLAALVNIPHWLILIFLLAVAAMFAAPLMLIGPAALVRFLIRVIPWLSWDYRNRRISRRQKCLACGNGGRKQLRYDPEQKLVIVQCPICMAAWGREPVVRAALFSKPAAEE
jgi:hypothetical protein